MSNRKLINQLFELAMQREAIISTAVDSGMAFPHVRGVEGGGLSMALGIHKKGIHFGGPGRTLSRVFFFMVIPTATSAFYCEALGLIPRCLQRVICRAGMAEVRCLPAGRRKGLLCQPFPPYKKIDTPSVCSGEVHLKLISGLSETFRQKEVREALLAAGSEEELWNALVRHTRKVIK